MNNIFKYLISVVLYILIWQIRCIITQNARSTYYLRWISGNDWSPNLQVGNITGGFQRDMSFSETQDRSDWMRADGLAEWTVTQYSVAGGTVGVDNLNANEFTK